MGWLVLRLIITNIFLWVFVKRLLAARRAKIVGLPLIFGLSRRSFFFYIHAAYWVFRHYGYSLLLVVTYKKEKLDWTLDEQCCAIIVSSIIASAFNSIQYILDGCHLGIENNFRHARDMIN